MDKKNWGFLKKRSSTKFRDMWPKNNNFRHISEKYRLEQSFLGLKRLKNEFLGLIF